AISTPQSMQMHVRDVVDRARGYGIPGTICDGFDPVASYAIVRDALERARGGGGPTLVEAKCYRFLSHSTDDDDRTYRTREAIEEHRKLDPVPRFEHRLIASGVIDGERAHALRADVLRETNEATDAAEAQAYPTVESLYSNVVAGDHRPWQESR
ncbi:MAG: thiamine pyrophosphate-dependent dehydrogenase E1 component subunit alpha, partial [Candidatus Eremiobacteraeota bacterium]|nr:thiamine pyrophosphate-dependent dehydrogenase E1 component subunit alpha [Candidatus Eremiobacteraeota bacterium]